MRSTKKPVLTIATLAVAASTIVTAAGAGFAASAQPSDSSAVGTPQTPSLTRAKYLQRARKICDAANTKVGNLPGGMFGYSLSSKSSAEWATKMARIAEQTLAKLHALPPPPGKRALIDKWFSFADRIPVVFRRLAAAASAGEATLAHDLNWKRIQLTHKEDGVGYIPEPCPMTLPA